MFANGNQTFPLGSGILDLNDSGASSAPTNVTDMQVQGGFTTPDPATGRGTLTLNCPSFDTVLGATTGITGTLNFVYYVIDATHLKVVEADTTATLSGDFYSAPPVSANMAGTQVFVVAGVDKGGSPYGVGGAFVTSGSGVLDLNDNGTLTSPPKGGTNITSAAPSLDATTGRINLAMSISASTSFNLPPICSITRLPTDWHPRAPYCWRSIPKWQSERESPSRKPGPADRKEASL